MPIEITKRNEDGRPEEYECHCGATIFFAGPGRDIECTKCGAEYNSAGQRLADRSQWGEETGETAQDYYRGLNDPEHAFDE